MDKRQEFYKKLEKKLGGKKALSLSQLAQEQEARKLVYSVEDLMYSFGYVTDSILYSAETHELSGKSKMDLMVNLVGELQSELQGIAQQFKSTKTNFHDVLGNKSVDVLEFQENGVSLFKGIDGKHYIHVLYSNNAIDLEGEILSEQGHKSMLAALDAGEIEPPELWVWHIPETAHKNRACWWDYDDGFAQALWELTPTEYANMLNYCKSIDGGVGSSHGYTDIWRADEDPTTLTQWSTFEVSILPLEWAANPIKVDGEKTKMNQQKLEALRQFAPSVAQQLDDHAKDAKDVIDADGRQRKNKEQDPEPVPPVETTPSELDPRYLTVEAFQKTFSEYNTNILALIAQKDATIQQLQDTLNGFSASLASVATQGESAIQNTPNDALKQLALEAAPTETAPTNGGHVLAGILPKQN